MLLLFSTSNRDENKVEMVMKTLKSEDGGDRGTKKFGFVTGLPAPRRDTREKRQLC